MNYKLLKAFDTKELPNDIYEYLVDYLEITNDTYVSWTLYENNNYVVPIFNERLNKWLLDRGAEMNEMILLKFSW